MIVALLVCYLLYIGLCLQPTCGSLVIPIGFILATTLLIAVISYASDRIVRSRHDDDDHDDVTHGSTCHCNSRSFTQTIRRSGCKGQFHLVGRGAASQSKFMNANSVLDSLFSLPTPSPGPSDAESVFFSRSKYSDPTDVIQIYVGFGINYSGSNQLLTCWNDLRVHHDWWSRTIAQPSWQQYRFFLSDCGSNRVLNVAGNIPVLLPTLSNWNSVRKQVLDLCIQQDAKQGKTEIVFYFSGHGYKKRTWDAQELDGQAECIVLLDGMYWDYFFANEFCSILPASIHMFAQFDSCHSGTVLNPRYTWNPISRSGNQTSPIQYAASIWVISGCQDYETSNSGPTDKDMSALTRCCIHGNTIMSTLPISGSKTPVDLYDELRTLLRSASEVQIPELSVSHERLFLIPLFA